MHFNIFELKTTRDFRFQNKSKIWQKLIFHTYSQFGNIFKTVICQAVTLSPETHQSDL